MGCPASSVAPALAHMLNHNLRGNAEAACAPCHLTQLVFMHLMRKLLGQELFNWKPFEGMPSLKTLLGLVPALNSYPRPRAHFEERPRLLHQRTLACRKTGSACRNNISCFYQQVYEKWRTDLGP